MSMFRIRIAGRGDLPSINSLVDQALFTWDTTERVKRLAQPVYHYSPEDLDHMWWFAAHSSDDTLIGIATLEEAASEDLPVPGRGLLLHGIFVKPESMGVGVGRSLLQTSIGISRELGYEGLLIKSVRQSRSFFESCGLDACPPVRSADYPYRYWQQNRPARLSEVLTGAS